jgi:pyruvate-formate lyase-activating enzyme
MHVRQFFLTPTYVCDEDCLMCGVPKSTRSAGLHFEESELRRVVDQMHLRDTDILTLSGGEPLLSPHFAEICRYVAARFGCRIWVLSNGRRLKSLDFASQLSDVGISKFIIPVFSHRAETHDAITQRKGSFLHTMKGLENLSSLKIPFNVKFIATRANYADLVDTYLFIREKFPSSRFIFSGLTYFGEAVANIAQVGLRYTEVAGPLNRALDVAVSRGDLLPVFMFPMCLVDPYYWSHYNVAAFEEVVVAPDHRDHADGRSLANTGPKPRKCHDCRMRGRCVFGWKLAYHAAFGDSEFRPIQQ